MKLTPEKLTAFCAALAETGIVARACAAVGVSRQCAYGWRDDMPDFAAAWDKALRIGITALEDEVHRRAFDGIPDPLTFQGQFTYLYDHDAIDPETGERYAVPPIRRDARGEPMVASVQKYSDTLAIFLLKAHNPEKYRDNSKVEIAGSLDLRKLTDEELDQEIEALAALEAVRASAKPTPE